MTTFLPDTVPAPHLWAHGAVGFVERSVDTWMTDQDDPAGHPVDADQLVSHLVTWLMKGMHT